MFQTTMKELVCIRVSVYQNALTRGKQYLILAVDEEKRQVRIKGDNGRTRWFPIYCFDQTSKSVPILNGYHLDDSITDSPEYAIEVTVQLSSGEKRWCIFVTPAVLTKCGDWIDGTKIRFHYRNHHVIVAEELSEDLIGRMLKYIDSQGELIACSLPLADTDDADDES